MSNNDTIFALASANGSAGVGIIRLSGSRALDVALKISKLKSIKPRTVYTTNFSNPENETIDYGVLLYFSAPKSFTGEDCIEIQCHGNNIIYNLFFKEFLKYDCRMARRGEFIQRAFLNNKVNISQVDATLNLINSTTERQHNLAIRSLTENTLDKFLVWREQLLEVKTKIIALLDFDDNENFDSAIENIDSTIDKTAEDITITQDQMEKITRIKNGINIVITGKVNQGKSTLFNSLINENRAIVSDESGTTRDIIEAVIEIAGFKVSVFDTAGIRETDSVVEKIGIHKANESIASADIVLNVVSQEEFLKNNRKIPDDLMENEILVLSKWEEDYPLNNKNRTKVFEVSVVKNTGLDELKKYLEKFITDNFVGDYPPILTQVEYIDVVNKCEKLLKKAVKIVDLDIKVEVINEALNLIASITGLTGNDEWIDKLFSSFCVGK